MNVARFWNDAQSLKDEMIARRRDFHRHPELGFQEKRTAAIVADALNELGLEVQTGIAETGVVVRLHGKRPGPVVLLRFDMDALPIQEQSGAAYASRIPGVMHACGHDGHIAVGLAVAQILASCHDDISGIIKFVFQPAEEGLGGAERMVAEGVLENPAPDYALAFHLWNDKPLGWIGITPGPIMAGAEIFQITIRGKGGHGALPHEAVDPVLAAAHVVSALQSIVSREIHPLNSAVVSVTQIRAGEAFNVIPETAQLNGTIRTFFPDVRAKVLQRVEEITRGIAGAMGCDSEIIIQRLTPPVVNDEVLAETMGSLAMELLPGVVVDDREVTMVSEDMALLMEKARSCYFFVGSNNPDKGLVAPHHSAGFDFDEDALPVAAALMAAAAYTLLDRS